MQNQDFGDVMMQLFETMKIDNGQISRVKYHTKRLKNSAQRLNFQFNEQLWHKLIKEVACKYPIGEYRLKVILNAEGDFETIVAQLPTKMYLRLRYKLYQILLIQFFKQ